MNSELKPVMEGIFDAGASPRLIGAICSKCNQKFFPKPMVCPHCLGEVEDVKLSPEGKLYTYAVLRTKAPYGLPQPYAVGWVDLEDDGLRIFSLLDPEKISELDFGKQVTLRVGAIGVDNNGQPCLRYYFTTKKKGCD
ncbi:MAG: hypothetical protein C4554_08835 [Dethiobacter sp.]|jgi:uncharacterized OB-fold protein|nr:MAG: hypothetical protein C4554_08835 [Dethiobacter sp.]